MKKRLIYLSICIGLIWGAFELAKMAPYHIYAIAISEGLNSPFLKLDATSSTLLDVQNSKINEIDRKDDNLFERLHLSYFEFPVPMNHSLFIKIPIIRFFEQKPYLGSKFLNGNGVELFSYQLEPSYRLDLSDDQQKIFTLPIFKKFIDKKNMKDKWKDIFSRNLSMKYSNDSIIREMNRLKNEPVFDLVYSLYILQNRKNMMPIESKIISFYEKKSIGIVELDQKEPKILSERIYILKDNTVYPIVIRTRIGNKNALNFRSRFIDGIEFRESEKDSAVAIYAKYQSLKFKKRLDEDGMYYLFAAWSHDVQKKDYIKYIIYFLEKGKNNKQYLTPFYEYTYKLFGTNFSTDSNTLIETAEEGIRRKISDSDKEMLRNLEKDTVIKNEFTNDEEKIFYHLNRSKEKNEIKTEKDILYVD